MKNPIRTLIICFAVVFVFASPLLAEKVGHVIDGDTFVLDNNQKVRMIGIDAPEISHPRYQKKGEYFGDEAKLRLSELVEKKEVILKAGPEAFDRFGRRLAYVYLPEGTFVNQKMVEEGYAETFRKFSFDFKDDFLKLEEKARAGKKGMWSESAVKTQLSAVSEKKKKKTQASSALAKLSPDHWIDSFVKKLEDWGIL